jgi:hypothetical protein
MTSGLCRLENEWVGLKIRGPDPFAIRLREALRYA